MTVDNPIPEESRRSGMLAALAVGAISAIPGAGPILAAGATETLRQAQLERVENWMAITNARLAELERVGVDVDITDPEFMAGLSRMVAAAVETADEKKHQILALAAARSGSWSPVPYDRRAEIIDDLATLSAAQVGVLALVVESQRKHAAEYQENPRTEERISLPEVAERLGLDLDDAERTVDRLLRRGLVSVGFPNDYPRNSTTMRLEAVDYSGELVDFLDEYEPGEGSP